MENLHDFDFLIGNWRVSNRKLQTRLAACSDWEHFPSRAETRAILGGAGNIEEIHFASSIGSTLRLFNPDSQDWSLYWTTSTGGVLQPPVVGRFHEGQGIFYGDDRHAGQPILVRYIWSHITTSSAQWEQAFSADSGHTWETNWIMNFSRIEQTSAAASIVELRQYAMKPGRVDDLIHLFDQHFLSGQEQVGMTMIGQFRNLDDPDRFVWLRGFPDMKSRQQSLEAFYNGPVWTEHRAAANETMLDSSDVLLLKPIQPLVMNPAATGPIVAVIHSLDAHLRHDVHEFFSREIAPQVRKAGADVVGQFETAAVANTFPRLPVREREDVFVWFAAFPTTAAYERQRQAFDSLALVEQRITKPTGILRLSPISVTRNIPVD